MPNQSSHSGVNRFVIPIKFFDEPAYVLVEYEAFEEDVSILSVRLCKQVAQSGEVFYRPDGTPLYGPVYEAVWIHGMPGSNDILSTRQLDNLFTYIATNKSLPNIPEERIIHATLYH